VDRALCVIAQSTTVALRLAAGRGDRRLFLSYAVEVPLTSESSSLTYWMTDAYAARLHVVGLSPALAAPPWDWLGGVAPDLLGRAIVSTTLDQVPDERLLVKPALLKLPEAPAAVRSLGDDCPNVCSLDVGWDTERHRWLVVEANPLWASGPYDCAPEPSVEAVEYANSAATGRWTWVPEATQLERARRQEPVVPVTQGRATGYVEFSA